jgi:class 3 adenylate cyclase/TolB-like protein/tetratricopeptide (TPR) repeat protein
MSQSRQLAAIMFTDIVGYTKLMGADENHALVLLRRNREIHRTNIEKYHGHLVKEMGDGILAKFASSTDAIHCAIEIQKQAQKTNLNERIRIGIHLGEITEENNDTFGDGVNIASRLQTIADPGGIYISESFQKSIRAQADIRTRFLGEFELKNVDFKLRTYAVLGHDLPKTLPSKIKELSGIGWREKILRSPMLYMVVISLALAGWWAQKQLINKEPTISSLVFLPFDNYTGSDTLDYLMAGMHDALIGEAGKIQALRVPGTKTANAYRGATKSTTEIASELNVDAIVETSVTCIENNICFQVKLITSFPEEKQIWVKDFNVEKDQIINWYRGLTKEISQEIKITLTPDEEALLASTDAVDPTAYDLYMKGKFYLNQFNEASLKMAKRYFNLAIKKEPLWGPPYAGLAEVGNYQKQVGLEPVESILPKIQDNLNKALELDPNSANTHYVNAGNAVWTEFNWEKGEKEFLRAIELNPNHAYARIFFAHFLMILRRIDEAMAQAKKAEELEPLDPFIQGLYVDVLRRVGDCEAAKEHADKGLSIDPNHQFTLHELLGAYECAGAYEMAFELKRTLSPWKQLWEQLGVTHSMDSIFQVAGWTGVVEEEIRLNEKYQLGGQDFVFQFLRYLELGNAERAIDYMEQLYELRNPNAPYISAIDHYNQLKDNPRYIALLDKMNLPLD